MARIPETFNFGVAEGDFKSLTRMLTDMYSQIALAINGVSRQDISGSLNAPSPFKVPSVYVTDAAPTSPAQINKLFEEGDMWIDRSAGPPQKVYHLTERTDVSTVTWTAVN